MVDITNDRELKAATDQASSLIQAIHDYCALTNRTIADVPEAKVQFPRGFIRTAGYQRGRFKFLDDHNLKSNIAYTLILSDTVLWLAVRTDVGGIAREMLNKLFIFLVGTIMESVTKEYLRGVCGRNYGARARFLKEQGVLDEQLETDICWVWETRNRMHLFQLDSREYHNEYNEENHLRAIRAFRGLLKALEERGPFVESANARGPHG
jgi:hypothetical protein